MSDIEHQKKLIKQIIKQLSGDVDENIDLVPECGINSDSGYIFCFQPHTRSFVKIYKNQNVYILGELNDGKNLLIYTTCGKIVEIDTDKVYEKDFS
jgi:hypothetical protein|tara:strand:- start:909 stop:1196 length:288 start_codon:yes stop_codon:yes gene_type:complete